MAFSLTSLSVFLATVATAYSFIRPLGMFGPGPILPMLRPPFLGPIVPPMIGPIVPPFRPILPPIGRPILPPFLKGVKKNRFTGPRRGPFPGPGFVRTGRTKLFQPDRIERKTVVREGRQQDDKLTINLIDGRDVNTPDVYIVGGYDDLYNGIGGGIDIGFDGGIGGGIGGIGGGVGGGNNFDRYFPWEDPSFNSNNEISIDGNLYINDPNAVRSLKNGASLNQVVGAAVGAGVGGVGRNDYDYALSSMPLDTGVGVPLTSNIDNLGLIDPQATTVIV